MRGIYEYYFLSDFFLLNKIKNSAFYHAWKEALFFWQFDLGAETEKQIVDKGQSSERDHGVRIVGGWSYYKAEAVNWRAGEGTLEVHSVDVGLSLLSPLGAQQYDVRAQLRFY